MQIKPKVLSTSSTRSSPNSNGIKSDSTQSQESSKSSSTQSQSSQLSQSSDTCDSSQTLSQNKSLTINTTNETINTINDEQSVDSSLKPVVTQKRKRPIPRVTDFLSLKNSETSSETPVKESESLQKDSQIISTNNESNGNKIVHNESCNLLTTKLYPVIEDSNETQIENITQSNSEVITSEKIDDLSIESETNKSKPVSNQSNEAIDENVANDKNLESDKQKDNELKSNSISKLSKIKKRKAPKTRSQTDKTKMTMKDLLQYNPPLTEEQKEQRKYDSESEKSGNEITNTTEKESKQSEDQISTKVSENSSGPRVKVGADGELILDEESVIVKRKKNSLDEPAVIETAKTTSACTNYSSFRTRAKTCHKPRWNEHETVRFYSALSLIGTDFTLMAQLFFKGKRTRLDLRNKFKKEEKSNRLMIDEALSSRNSFINQCEELKDLMNCDTSSDESDKETDDKSVSKVKV
jgi:hypothetical protein